MAKKKTKVATKLSVAPIKPDPNKTSVKPGFITDKILGLKRKKATK